MGDSYLEPLIRLGFFAGIFVILAFAEALLPRRRSTEAMYLRWPSNLGMMVINTLAARVLLPTGAVGMSLLAEEWSWGIFNNVELPFPIVVVLCIVTLDLTIYLQHRMFHAMPLLWRLHRVHHADVDFDVTTGVRFHAIEIALSLLIKIGAVALLGAPALAVLIFEIALNATALFNHANLRLPDWLDRVLRWIVVTPDMHRVHHSTLRMETNSNFGFNFPWWDYLFGTYMAQPREGHEQMTIGLSEYRDGAWARLYWLLLMPFCDGEEVKASEGEAPAEPASQL